MVWRSSTDVKDRIFSGLVYSMPLLSVHPFGTYVFNQFPPLSAILDILIFPAALVYGFDPSGGLLVFFILFAAVVRNERIPHFIRFNTVQAILIGIALFLVTLCLRLIGALLPPLIVNTLSSIIFTMVLAACIYSIVQSVLGKYAEIPTISQAAYAQVP